MRHHPALSCTYRCVSILLGRAALRAGQHVDLLFPPIKGAMRKSGRSSTQHQRYHVLSAAALNNSRKRSLFTGKIMAASRRVSSAEHAGETYLVVREERGFRPI